MKDKEIISDDISEIVNQSTAHMRLDLSNDCEVLVSQKGDNLLEISVNTKGLETESDIEVLEILEFTPSASDSNIWLLSITCLNDANGLYIRTWSTLR